MKQQQQTNQQQHETTTTTDTTTKQQQQQTTDTAIQQRTHDETTIPQRQRYNNCWKPSSPFSNVHFRKYHKKLQHKFFALNFGYLYF